MGKMDSREPMSDNEIDENLAESFPSSDPPSWTLGTNHKTEQVAAKKPAAMQIVFHKLAKLFNGLHWAIGITTLPATATPTEERSFVLMWVGIVVFVIVFFIVFIRLL